MSARAIRQLLIRMRTRFAGVYANGRRLAGEFSCELARLNHAGIDARIAGLSRSERTRAVKKALREKHHETARCC